MDKTVESIVESSSAGNNEVPYDALEFEEAAIVAEVSAPLSSISESKDRKRGTFPEPSIWVVLGRRSRPHEDVDGKRSRDRTPERCSSVRVVDVEVIQCNRGNLRKDGCEFLGSNARSVLVQ